MTTESATPAPPSSPRKRWPFVLAGAIVLVVAATALLVWQLGRGGCDDGDYAVDQPTRLCFVIPDGWKSVPVKGGHTQIAPADAPEGHGVWTWSAEGPIEEVGGDLASQAMAWVKGFAQLADSTSNVDFAEESARTLTVDGHPAATATVVAKYVDDPEGRQVYMRLTVVDLGGPAPSGLIGYTDPALRGTVDEIHDGLAVLPS